MTRTIIALNEGDKKWLDRQAAKEGISMAEVIRRAVQKLRAEKSNSEAFESLLKETAGIGSGEDGLTVQRRLRDEW
ncbi:MAG: ribbon-helix-helix protein, CopG family [Myxococcota bacterium]